MNGLKELNSGGLGSAVSAASACAGKRSVVRSFLLVFAAATFVSGCDSKLDKLSAPDEQDFVVSDIVLDTANQ